ncbi:MAG: DUF1064 domain-containing protein [Acidobacteriota bacterium]
MSRFSGWSEKNLSGLNIIQDGGSVTLPAAQEEVKRHKYNAIKMETGGETYDSTMEGLEAQKLDWQVKAGTIRGYEKQIRIPLMVAGVKICDYIIDFKVIHLDGSEELVEVKGFPTPAWRLKHKLFCALYPDLKITVVMKPKAKKRKKGL